MPKPWILRALLITTLFAPTCRLDSQTNPLPSLDAEPYNLRVSVDEVSLTFHAADSHGFPINDLKLSELTLLDNGQPPRKILAFQSLQNFPIRAGILIDLSPSMQETRSSDRTIAIRYAQQFLRQQTDQAFVMNFDFLSTIAQPWTSDPSALTAGIRNRTVTAGNRSRIEGTAIFDAIYRACLNQFGHIDNAASANFILLFSDGEENAGHGSLKTAVDTCQRSHTAIYAFHPQPKPGFSDGLKTLEELASESGGRVFYNDGSEVEIEKNLRLIEADLRNQYRLIYKPPAFKNDGSFHRIELKVPERVDSLTIRSGYYAPFH